MRSIPKFYSIFCTGGLHTPQNTNSYSLCLYIQSNLDQVLTIFVIDSNIIQIFVQTFFFFFFFKPFYPWPDPGHSTKIITADSGYCLIQAF